MTIQEAIDGIAFLWEQFVDALKKAARALGELIGVTIAGRQKQKPSAASGVRGIALSTSTRSLF